MGKAKAPPSENRVRKTIRDLAEKGDIEGLLRALTTRQRRFCEEYIIDFNGSAAYVRAGYSPNYADRGAYQLLQNPGIRCYIDHLTRSKEAAITLINPDYVIARVTEIINSAEKDSDKLRGLELLARHLGMFIERTEITGKDGGPIEHKKMAEDAQEFARTLAGLVDRSKKVDVEIV